MERITVISSDLASVGYDTINNILEIEFKKGGIYQYYGVPNNIYDGLMNANSLGSYFNKNIKNGGFSFKKVI